MNSYVVILRKLLLGITVFGALSGAAGAVDVNAGDLTNKSFVQAYSYGPNATVNDVFHFDLTSPSTFNAIASEIYLQNFFNISNFSLTLTIPGTLPTTLAFGPAGTAIWTNQLMLPQAGGFSVNVTGVVDGILGGGYSLLMAAAAVPLIPVPEPSQWLMLLVGVVVMARFMFSRQRIGGAVAQ